MPQRSGRWAPPAAGEPSERGGTERLPKLLTGSLIWKSTPRMPVPFERVKVYAMLCGSIL